MKDGTPNTTDRTAKPPAQPPEQTADASMDIANQPVVLEPEEEVSKINQGDMLEPLVRQHDAKSEERP